MSDTGSNIKIIGTTGSLSITAGDGALLELDGFAARDVNVTLQNGVTGKINASGTVTGRASDGVLMSVTDGGTIIR